jgi:hypothetical protein
MKDSLKLLLVSILLFTGVQNAIAQNGTPSSKATADVNTLVRCHMSTAQVTGGTSTAEAMGAVYMRALLIDSNGNPIYAAPLTYCNAGILGCAPNAAGWGVLLDARIQTLTQSISQCIVDVATIVGANDGTCTFTSTIDLVTKTASAHTFNFIFPNVGVGVYTLRIQAAVASGASVFASDGSGATAVGAAAFGLGSMTAESVCLVHGFEF